MSAEKIVLKICEKGIDLKIVKKYCSMIITNKT